LSTCRIYGLKRGVELGFDTVNLISDTVMEHDWSEIFEPRAI